MWLGFSQALKPCQAGLSISIDAAFTAFTRGGMNLVDLMAEMCNCSSAELRDGLDFEHNRISRLVKGLRVRACLGCAVLYGVVVVVAVMQVIFAVCLGWGVAVLVLLMLPVLRYVMGGTLWR